MRKDGSVAATALLTKDQYETLRTAHKKIGDLKEERRCLEQANTRRIPRDRNDTFSPRTVEDISAELARISRKISKLEKQLDQQLDALVDDLDLILGSRILEPWISHRVTQFNSIVAKLDRLNSLDGFSQWGPVYERKRIVSAKDKHHKPARYWLNENFQPKRKYHSIVSIVSSDYPLIGIKGNWFKHIGGRKLPVAKRETLKAALMYEEKHNVKVIPRSEDEALTLREIDNLIRSPPEKRDVKTITIYGPEATAFEGIADPEERQKRVEERFKK